jgi:hypothetical protein|nr:MAG TPA: Medulloblastoma antigen MU-MB-50.72 domain, LYSINE-METHYLATED P53 BINDING.0A [Caudoviricetes sp.]
MTNSFYNGEYFLYIKDNKYYIGKVVEPKTKSSYYVYLEPCIQSSEMPVEDMIKLENEQCVNTSSLGYPIILTSNYKLP